MTITQELKKATVTSPYVEMLWIDGTTVNAGLNFYLTNSSDYAFSFNGKQYVPFPYKLEGMESTTGQPPRPKLIIANVNKLIQPYLQQYQDLKRVKVSRIRTLAKHLDGGTAADPTMTLPIDEYYINAMTLMDRTSVQFELANILDMPNVMLPAAQALKDNLGTKDLYAPGLSSVRFRG